ncbi:MAG: hypothetical protein K2X47_03520 [Bdellovibrionales bacterium]|nr:hypothetical protein [Bdellovibrionales bacterium]
MKMPCSAFAKSLFVSFLCASVSAVGFYSPETSAKTEIRSPAEAAELPESDDVAPPPHVKFGKDAATENFRRSRRAVSEGPLDHYLGIHFGGFVASETWRWGGQPTHEGTGRMTAGVTYRMDEWNKMDVLIRGDFETFKLTDGEALKFSFLGSVIFPEAASRFPLYFGGALGPGIYFRQLPGESPLSLDYQLFAGARFFNVFEDLGFTLEGGWKNLLHLVSDGQMNGTFVALGMVFTF